MTILTDFITHWGEVIEFTLPKLDVSKIKETVDNHPGWKAYQPHKPGYNRFGLSVTSLDGEFSGEPDLYALGDWYKMTGEIVHELDIKARTNLCQLLPELDTYLDFWEPNLGRAHFLRLDKGGYFPPHRDGHMVFSGNTFRILIPIHNFGTNDMKWIQEEKVLKLDLGITYFINTSRLHSLFSFVDNCLMLVLNVNADEELLNKMSRKIVGF